MVNVLHSVTDHLKKVLGQDKISFLDSSCGDMNWMPDFLNNRTDMEFHGYDYEFPSCLFLSPDGQELQA